MKLSYINQNELILTVTEHIQSKMASLGSDLTSLKWTLLLFAPVTSPWFLDKKVTRDNHVMTFSTL